MRRRRLQQTHTPSAHTTNTDQPPTNMQMDHAPYTTSRLVPILYRSIIYPQPSTHYPPPATLYSLLRSTRHPPAVTALRLLHLCEEEGVLGQHLVDDEVPDGVLGQRGLQLDLRVGQVHVHGGRHHAQPHAGADGALECLRWGRLGRVRIKARGDWGG